MDNNSNDNQTLINSENPILQEPPTPETPIRPPIEITPEPELVKPPIEVTPEPEIMLPPAPEITLEPEITPEPSLTDFDIAQKPASKSNFLKIVFISSLVIFLLVCMALVFVYFKSKNNSNTNTNINTNVKTPTSVPTSTKIESCILNDKTYDIGSSFVASDGCNTCTCTSKNNITCTDNECSSVKTSTKSAVTVTPTSSKVKTSTPSSVKK